MSPHIPNTQKQTESLPAANYVKQNRGSNSVRLYILSYSFIKNSTFFPFSNLYSNYQAKKLNTKNVVFFQKIRLKCA
jgi:hypothetical protein